MAKPSSPDPAIRSGSGFAGTAATVCAGLVMLTACFVGGAQAEELQPVQSRTIAMGLVNGAAYYTNDADGSRLVTTLNGGNGRAPVRIVATLAAGQSLTLSVPAGVGEPAAEVTFSSRDGRVLVDDNSMQMEPARSRRDRAGQPK